MTDTPIGRRAFSTLLIGGLASTTSLVEAAVQEAQTSGKISDETAKAILDHIGYPAAGPDEMAKLRPLIEETLRDIDTIRKFDVSLTLEPSFVFYPNK